MIARPPRIRQAQGAMVEELPDDPRRITRFATSGG
jgi:hypothetical protein